jgi:hypothetical protein
VRKTWSITQVAAIESVRLSNFEPKFVDSQAAKPGEVERLLARHFEKSPVDASVNAFLIKYGKTLS